MQVCSLAQPEKIRYFYYIDMTYFLIYKILSSSKGFRVIRCLQATPLSGLYSYHFIFSLGKYE